MKKRKIGFDFDFDDIFGDGKFSGRDEIPVEVDKPFVANPDEPIREQIAKHALQYVSRKRPELVHRAASMTLLWGVDKLEAIAQKARCFAMTNGFEIYLAEPYFRLADDKERAAVMAHELSHAEMSHPYRMSSYLGVGAWNRRHKGSTKKKGGPCETCAQLAADWIVNTNLIESGSGFPKETIQKIPGANLPKDDEDSKLTDELQMESLARHIHKKYHKPGDEEGEEEEENDEQDASGSAGSTGAGGALAKNPEDGKPSDEQNDSNAPQQTGDIVCSSSDLGMQMMKSVNEAQKAPAGGRMGSVRISKLVRSENYARAEKSPRWEEIGAQIALWAVERAVRHASGGNRRTSRRIYGEVDRDILWPMALRKIPSLTICLDVSGSVVGHHTARRAILEIALALEAALRAAHGGELETVLFATMAERNPDYLQEIGGWDGIRKKVVDGSREDDIYRDIGGHLGGGTNLDRGIKKVNEQDDSTALVVISDFECDTTRLVKFFAGRDPDYCKFRPEDVALVGAGSMAEQAFKGFVNLYPEQVIVDAW